jgi:hypothetical protein
MVYYRQQVARASLVAIAPSRGGDEVGAYWAETAALRIAKRIPHLGHPA